MTCCITNTGQIVALIWAPLLLARILSQALCRWKAAGFDAVTPKAKPASFSGPCRSRARAEDCLSSSSPVPHLTLEQLGSGRGLCGSLKKLARLTKPWASMFERPGLSSKDVNMPEVNLSCQLQRRFRFEVALAPCGFFAHVLDVLLSCALGCLHVKISNIT